MPQERSNQVPPPRLNLQTHEVENQPVGRHLAPLWSGDAALSDWGPRMGGDAAHLAAFAGVIDTDAMLRAGRDANRCPPEMVTFDRHGGRLDEVRFHPGWHALMTAGVGAGYVALPWTGAAGGHVSHAAMVYLMTQIEPGCCCPMTMSYAAVPALAADSGLQADWVPGLIAQSYDPAIAPRQAKSGLTMGMAMTEKQGGSDLRGSSTRAAPDGPHWRLTGHKWFCSAPMSDAFLTLAQTPAGLTCFLVPRWLEGERNAIHLMRLKDKLGNRSNASAEIEYHGALAHQLGEAGAGVRTIIEMVHHTRLDTAMAPAGLMRAALAEALRWCAHRTAFQRRLIDAPLMRCVLADLALETEAALALGLWVARLFDGQGAQDRPLARLAVALAKFQSNKRCVPVVAEAMECLGGMGYVEDTPLPLLYREAPLNAIWEGSGNVICLDILRTLARDRQAGAALDAVLDGAAALDGGFATALAAHRARFAAGPAEAEARQFALALAALLTGAVLLEGDVGAVAESWIATRLTGQGAAVPGATPGLAVDALIARLGG